MKKLFWFIVVTFSLVALTILCLGVAVLNDWPMWVGAAILVCVLCLMWFLPWIGRKIYVFYRHRQREQASQVIDFDARIVLKKKWKEALAVLKRSSLKRFGNPIYVLPWYMVLGHAGSGQTTALMRAWSASPLKKIVHKDNAQEAINIDWWYFDRAVVIDASSRYVAQADNLNDEWQYLLSLLKRARSREGLNGLVLTISAQSLWSSDTQTLIEQAKSMRVRVEQLIRLFNKRFPIYLLITQADAIYGMEHFCQALPEELWQQAIGYLDEIENKISPSISTSNQADFIDRAFDAIGEKFNRLRFKLMQNACIAQPQALNCSSQEVAQLTSNLEVAECDRQHQKELGLLLFPNELKELQIPLKNFLHHALGNSAYLEKPFLRGLFFTSALQLGGSISKTIDTIRSDVKKEAQHAGFFLQDIFNRILPVDRHLSTPTLAARRSWSRRYYLAIGAWIFAICVAIGYFSFSFVDQINLLEQAKALYPKESKVTGHLSTDVRALEALHRFIVWLDKQDRNHYLAFNRHLDRIQARLKENYVADFRKHITPAWDQAFDSKVATLMQGKQSEQMAGYVQMLVRRINFVQARINGADARTLNQMPPIPAYVMSDMVPNLSDDLANRFNQMYISELLWTANDLPRLYRLDVLRNRLHKLALSSDDLQWLVNWVEGQPGLAKVNACDFWANACPLGQVQTIPAAFTRNGKARIDAFVEELRKSEPDFTDFDQKWQSFNQWYFQEKLRVWYSLVAQVNQDGWLNSDQEGWRQSLIATNGEHNPYLLLMQRLAFEFDETSEQNMPAWLALNKHLLLLHKRSLQNKVIEESAVMADVGSSLVRDIAHRNQITAVNTDLTKGVSAINYYRNYLSKLSNVTSIATTSLAQAAQLAAAFHSFATDATVRSDLQESYARLADLRRVVEVGNDLENQTIWTLFTQPLIQVTRYVDRQASCALQQEWEAQVAGPVRMLGDDPESVAQFYRADGGVSAFLAGPAKPYITRKLNGYRVVETMGEAVPFTPNFLDFINAMAIYQARQKIGNQRKLVADQRASLEQQIDQQQLQHSQQQIEQRITELQQTSAQLSAMIYPIKITGLPTDLNQDASVNVVSTLLSVECSDETFRLHNLNFSVSGMLNWSPQTCGNTILEIRFPNFTLTKRYPFAEGFLVFARDFRHGTHIFTPSDFPADQDKIKQAGIKTIVVRYQLSGVELALKNNARLLDNNLALATANSERRKIESIQIKNNQQLLEKKVHDTMPIIPTISIPQQIGQCWSRD